MSLVFLAAALALLGAAMVAISRILVRLRRSSSRKVLGGRSVKYGTLRLLKLARWLFGVLLLLVFVVLLLKLTSQLGADSPEPDKKKRRIDSLTQHGQLQPLAREPARHYAQNTLR